MSGKKNTITNIEKLYMYNNNMITIITFNNTKVNFILFITDELDIHYADVEKSYLKGMFMEISGNFTGTVTGKGICQFQGN